MIPVISQEGRTIRCSGIGWTVLRVDSKYYTYATIVALSRASGLQERRMDEQQYQTALKPIRSPHTRPEKYRGVGANRTNFFSFSVCSEIWTIGTMATSWTNCQTITEWNEWLFGTSTHRDKLIRINSFERVERLELILTSSQYNV